MSFDLSFFFWLFNLKKICFLEPHEYVPPTTPYCVADVLLVLEVPALPFFLESRVRFSTCVKCNTRFR